jgi:hypothetical protein
LILQEQGDSISLDQLSVGGIIVQEDALFPQTDVLEPKLDSAGVSTGAGHSILANTEEKEESHAYKV